MNFQELLKLIESHKLETSTEIQTKGEIDKIIKTKTGSFTTFHPSINRYHFIRVWKKEKSIEFRLNSFIYCFDESTQIIERHTESRHSNYEKSITENTFMRNLDKSIKEMKKDGGILYLGGE